MQVAVRGLSAVLTAGILPYYTAPAKTRAVLKKLTATNTTMAAALITVYLVPPAGIQNPDGTLTTGLASAANTLTYKRSVPAGATVDLYEALNHVLESGTSLQMASDTAAALTVMVSGVEVS